MKTHKSLEQRIVSTYLDMLPHLESVQEDNQPKKEMIQILHDLFTHLYDKPSLLFSVLHPDDAYTNRFNKSADNKPELLKDMRSAEKKINSIIEFLSSLGGNDTSTMKTKVPASVKNVLNDIGVDISLKDGTISFSSKVYSSVRNALSALHKEIMTNSITNYRCLFFTEQSALANYRSLSGNPAQFDKLIGYLKPSYHFFQTPNSISLEYIKGKHNSIPLKGGFQYKVNHIGISMYYEPLVKMSASFSLCIPSMKKLLTFFNDMDDLLKQFVLLMTKKCDNCRYCVQTDKTGKRERAFIGVKWENKMYDLCPYFPGYSYTFDHLDERIVEYMIKLLVFMDERLIFLTT